MINKKFIQKLKKEFDDNNSERRQIISLANVVLHDSKRVIFALHRGDVARAGSELEKIEDILQKLEKKFTYSRLASEGSYKAAVEEYVEAKMFYLLNTGKKIDQIKGIKISFDNYLGGICDTTGELVRRAINQAARGNFQEVEKIRGLIDDIMAELVEFDMTSYLRTKYDQAKTNLRKIEQIGYETAMRNCK